MREKDIEQMLIREVRKRNGLALKFISPGINGVPDRLVLLPGGRMAFVELKAPGRKMRPIQIKRKRQLETLGFLVYCTDKKEQIGGVLDEVEGRKNRVSPA
ncbi:VRR-NUC domain-containing protein [Clostridium tyrobutyricum]|uniref:VRR-NUC domain-containing protein n=1 Tax=Clostridium tyrobutyricum TaxID=1519 RepID=UPI0010AB1AF1|nr:VRR-NUC domain-containing protein [Clostridium tyrobutyricum]QCH27818.1 VRR-NUC domain protein [Clostridium tyrobutyricum]